jgi:hypothetical protein
MIRYVPMVHWHYEDTNPAEGHYDDEPVPTYATREEALKVADAKSGNGSSSEILVIEVPG